jgi:D-beta-D-heptose 7-phosphate kinase / D-beta-D-heptose 1-phosphate adenosyltransferase
LPDLSTVLGSFPLRCIAVIGDLMLDEYLWGHIARISPEAPVPILNLVRRSTSLGGAGNVVENLRSFGVDVALIGVVGDDETGRQICDLLKIHGVETTGVVTDEARKSTRKVRLVSLEHGQQVFRLDEESTSTVDKNIEEKMMALIRGMKNDIEAIVCSDYLKGVLSERILASIFSVARKRGIPSIVAPKDSNSAKYRGADILMPNLLELRQLSSDNLPSVWSLDESAHNLIQSLSLKALVVTRGSQGMSLFENMRGGLRRVDIPTTARSVYDVTGAGDTAIAAFATAVASGADLETAARLANVFAGIKVGKRGTATVSLEEIRQSL